MVWLPDLDLGTAYRTFLAARYHLGLTKIKEMPGPTQSLHCLVRMFGFPSGYTEVEGGFGGVEASGA